MLSSLYLQYLILLSVSDAVTSSLQRCQAFDQRLKSEYEQRSASNDRLLEFRKKLPAWELREVSSICTSKGFRGFPPHD